MAMVHAGGGSGGAVLSTHTWLMNGNPVPLGAALADRYMQTGTLGSVH